MWVRRMIRPTLVTRLSSAPAQRAPSVSLATRIDRSLIHLEFLASLADAALPVDDGPAVGQLDREREGRQDGAATISVIREPTTRSKARLDAGEPAR